MQKIENMYKPDNAEDCKKLWCETCVYDKDIECKGLKVGWIK